MFDPELLCPLRRFEHRWEASCHVPKSGEIDRDGSGNAAFYLLQRSGGGSEVAGSVGEGAVFVLQGAALRVVVVKPARAGLQGPGGDGLPLGVRSGGLGVAPVSYEDPPSLNCEGDTEIRAPPPPGRQRRSSTRSTTSEDLVLVLEQRLEAAALLLQQLEGRGLQQRGDLADREAP